MITAYAQLLAQRYDKEFDKDSAMFMDNIIQGAKRMR